MMDRMPERNHIKEIASDAVPAWLPGAWPEDQPLVGLFSSPENARWNRWSILGIPSEYHCVSRRDAGEGGRVPEILDIIQTGREDHRDMSDRSPFHGGWIGMLAYELGFVLEPSARSVPETEKEQAGCGLIEMARIDSALVHDNLERRWLLVGDQRQWPLLESILASSTPPATAGDPIGRCAVTPDAEGYMASIRKVIELIHEGDLFQANIGHMTRGETRAGPRSIATRALGAAPARFGAYLELPGERAILSLSPELFLDVTPDGEVTTCPIKGTRSETGCEIELHESPKDRAELNMIIDLMRNDLGRCCTPGSIRVASERDIEHHPTIMHASAEILGRLPAGCSMSELLSASFPPGSVTGAPKIRAMQVIDQLEDFQRGPWCGSIGFFSSCGHSMLSVAIRTMLLEASRVEAGSCRFSYAAGCGIVSDSDPELEYRESMDKCAVLDRFSDPVDQERGVNRSAAAPAAT